MRIIAMGFPSKAIEGIYRNSMEDVKNFFAKRHSNHYKYIIYAMIKNMEIAFINNDGFLLKIMRLHPLI